MWYLWVFKKEKDNLIMYIDIEEFNSVRLQRCVKEILFYKVDLNGHTYNNIYLEIALSTP